MPVFEIPDFRLQNGATLPVARVAYETYGRLNASRSNAILYPTSYGATHQDLDWLVGPGRILDSDRYWIAIVNMFGNGLSSSPSNFAEPWGPQHVEMFTHVDNVRAQRLLLEHAFGVEQLELVYGWSMGAQQAYHWGALHAGQVARIAAICGTAKTSPHNLVFLEGIQAALTGDPAWNGAQFVARPERGLRALGRVYAGWALSQDFYRQRKYLELGYGSLEDFLVRDWEASFLRRDAANLLSMIHTWKRADISANPLFRGDLDAALGAIQADTLIMPATSDLYFPPEDCEREAAGIAQAEFLPIPSLWGHRAGNPRSSPDDQRFIAAAVQQLLSR